MEKENAQSKYIKEKTDRISLYTEKGYREIIEERAKELKKSKNKYILDLIEEDMGKSDTVEMIEKSTSDQPE